MSKWRESFTKEHPPRTAEAVSFILRRAAYAHSVGDNAFTDALERIADKIDERNVSFEQAMAIYDDESAKIDRVQMHVGGVLKQYKDNIASLHLRRASDTSSALAKAGHL